MSELQLRLLDARAADFDDALTRLLDRGGQGQDDVEAAVAGIIARVRAEGDHAVVEYTRRFDRIDLDVAGLELPRSRIDQARSAVPREQWRALESACARIRDYHQHQRQESWDYREADGTRLGQKITALDRVGLYVPGGTAAYPSSVLMNAVPAKVAGVQELVMAVPTPDGEINELVLAAADLAGVDRVFRIGGAQAVAALAYGTGTIPAVDKIVGPGNIYVATAKRQVFGKVGIDMIAGPSEVLVVGDGNADPEWAAMDLFAQAEHDELAQAILLSCDRGFIDRVRATIDRLLPTLSRADIVRRSLSDHGALIHAADRRQMLAIIDRIAPEHLELMIDDAAEFAEQVAHAGAIFIGPYSAEALGDYCAGPNHVLPTAGTARFSSPLGVYDFQKRTSIIECSATGAAALGRTAEVLARAEALTAHARSARYRVTDE